MKQKKLLTAMTEVDEKYINESAPGKKPSKVPKLAKWSGAIAACLCLVVGGGLIAIIFMGGRAQGGGSATSDLRYMYYAGPVLPLTFLEQNDNIRADRDVTLDFSPYISQPYEYMNSKGEPEIRYRADAEVMITDRYNLKNDSDSDQTVTALYPFIGSYNEPELRPTITVDGNTVDAEIHYGPYAGDYMGVWGGNQKDMETGSVNLRPLECYEDFDSLLHDGSYMASALDEFPSLEIPVTVYQMSDYVYTADTEAPNPTLNMEFYIDFEQTTVLTFGFNGGTNNRETGYVARHNGGIEVRPNAHPDVRYPGDAYIILIGDDIESYTVQGYSDGSCDQGKELEDLSCTITRYESTLGEMVRQFTADDEEPEVLYNLTAELFVTDGPLGDLVERYDNGMIGSLISAARTNTRVMYAGFEITIPAGESVSVEVASRKDASVDYIGKDKGRDGYGLATRLGSNLVFTEQNAAIAGYDEITIINQNFGFDPDNGITSVPLDMNMKHYYIEVMKIRTKE